MASWFFEEESLQQLRSEQLGLDLLITALLKLDPRGHGLGVITAAMSVTPRPGTSPLYFNNTDCYGEIPSLLSTPSALVIELEGVVDIDGFVLVEGLAGRGMLRHSGLYFDGSTYQPLTEMGIPNDRPLWRRYGFATAVGTGHLNAIAASYLLDTVTMRLSGEHGSLRVFSHGKIVGSTYAVEIAPSLSLPSKVERPLEVFA